MKYKKEYLFDGYQFVFSSDSYETLKKQESHIQEFYISADSQVKNTIYIEILEDEDIFHECMSFCEGLQGKAYQSFENQIHYEYSYDNKKIFILDRKEYICVKKDDTHYLILSDGSEKSIKWPFRILREIFVRLEEDEKKLFMHGTGISVDEQGVLFLGGSGSGKTSLAIKAIESKEQMSFYSNDRMFLYRKNNQLEMSYYPIPVVYAMGTVKNNDDLDRYFRKTRILEKRSNKSYELSAFEDKVDVPLTDHLKIFDNIDLKTNCPLKLIIFPKMIKTLQDSNPKIITLNKDSKRILLEQTCFTPFDWESLRFPWIYQRKSCMEDIISKKYDILNTVIEEIEIIELQYGFQISPQKLMKEINRRI